MSNIFEAADKTSGNPFAAADANTGSADASAPAQATPQLDPFRQALVGRVAELRALGHKDKQIEDFVARSIQDPSFFQASEERRKQFQKGNPAVLGASAVEGFKTMGSNEPLPTAGELGDFAMRGGGPVIGQSIGALPSLSIPSRGLSVPILGALGGAGGEIAAEARAGKGFSSGRIWGAAIGGSTPFKGALPLQMLRGAAHNVVAKEVESIVDEGKSASLKDTALAGTVGAFAPVAGRALEGAGTLAAQINRTATDAIIAEAQKAGLKILPSKVNPMALNHALEAIAGKAETVDELTARNEDIARSLALKDIGQPQIAPSIKAEIQAARDRANIPYQKIESISQKAQADIAALNKSSLTSGDYHEAGVQAADPAYVKKLADLTVGAEADIKSMRDWRQAEKIHWNKFEETGNPESQIRAIEAGKKARDIEAKIEEMTKAIGNPELYEQLKAGRRILAKTYEIENALGVRDSIDMRKLARSQAGGAPMDSNLKVMADFANEFAPIAGTTQGQGYGSKTIGNPTNSLTAAARFIGNVTGARKAARNFLISGGFQNSAAAQPFYQTAPSFASSLAKFSTQTLGRTPPPQNNPFLQPSQ